MTYAEAFRQIVEQVNASRNGTCDYKDMGTLAKWTKYDADDESITLDSLVLTMKVGVAGKKQRIRDDGNPPDAEDVKRVTRNVLDYFGHPTH